MYADAELIRRANGGDEAATRALIEQLRGPLSDLAVAALARGVPRARLDETLASALAAAIATFGAELARGIVPQLAFRDYATVWLERALGELITSDATLLPS